MLVAPNGSKKSILLLYDGGCQSTSLSTSLSDYFHDTKPVQYWYTNANKSQFVRGSAARITIENECGKKFNLEGLVQQLSTAGNQSQTYYIPEQWQVDHQLNPTMTTQGNGRIYTIIIGQDLGSLMPREISRSGNLRLFKSVVTDKWLIAGSDSQQSRLGPVCSNMRISASQTSTDQHWMDTMAGIDFVIMPSVCDVHKKHSSQCSDCKQKINKSPLVRYEEEVLSKSVKLVPDGVIPNHQTPSLTYQPILQSSNS